MNKIKDFTDTEKREYSNLYSTIINAVYEISDVLTDDELSRRPYVTKIDSIKEYLKRIDDANFKADKKGFLDIFKSDEIYKNELLEFKKTIKHDIRFLKKCAQCKCLNCIKTCPFEGCKNCNLSEIVKACDKSEKCIYHGLKNIQLYHHDFNKDIDFIVLGRLVYQESQYLLLRNSDNEEDLQLYRYIVETNGEEDFQSLTDDEIDVIWDIFISMGIGR